MAPAFVASLATAIGLGLLAQAVIYAGVAFTNGQFIPSYLDGFYEQTGHGVRLLMAAVTFFTVGNYLIAGIYRIVDAGYAGVIIPGTLVVILIAKAVLLGVGALTPRVLIAASVLVMAAVWVAWELHRVT